jgi:hypothetical protein
MVSAWYLLAVRLGWLVTAILGVHNVWEGYGSLAGLELSYSFSLYMLESQCKRFNRYYTQTQEAAIDLHAQGEQAFEALRVLRADNDRLRRLLIEERGARALARRGMGR